MLSLTICLALLSSFAVLTLGKAGLFEYCALHAPKQVAKACSCSLCVSFWANVVVAVLVYMLIGDQTVLVCPLVATPLTRILIQ
jgi:hypothetical protein